MLEYFPNSLIYTISIESHRKCMGREGPFKTNKQKYQRACLRKIKKKLEGAARALYVVLSIRTKQILLPVEPANKSFLLQRGATLDARRHHPTESCKAQRCLTRLLLKPYRSNTKASLALRKAFSAVLL